LLLLAVLEVKFGLNGSQNHKHNKIADLQLILVNRKKKEREKKEEMEKKERKKKRGKKKQRIQ